MMLSAIPRCTQKWALPIPCASRALPAAGQTRDVHPMAWRTRLAWRHVGAHLLEFRRVMEIDVRSQIERVGNAAQRLVADDLDVFVHEFVVGVPLDALR